MSLMQSSDSGWAVDQLFTYEEARNGGFLVAGDDAVIQMRAKVSFLRKQKMRRKAKTMMRLTTGHDPLIDGYDTARAPSAHRNGVKDQ